MVSLVLELLGLSTTIASLISCGFAREGLAMYYVAKDVERMVELATELHENGILWKVRNEDNEGGRLEREAGIKRHGDETK
jgi:hypothetical protein